MATIQLITRKGNQVDNPAASDLAAALAEMEAHDPDNPGCSLSSSDGWMLSFFDGGLVTLENPDKGEGPWHIAQSNSGLRQSLAQALVGGNIEQLKAQGWKPGYGD